MQQVSREAAKQLIPPLPSLSHTGQEIEVKVRFTPRTTGPISLFGVCNMVGAPLPCGFAVSRCVVDSAIICHRMGKEFILLLT